MPAQQRKKRKKCLDILNMRHKIGWRLPQFQFDKSCVSKSTTMEYNKEAAEEATKLVMDFFSKTLNK